MTFNTCEEPSEDNISDSLLEIGNSSEDQDTLCQDCEYYNDDIEAFILPCAVNPLNIHEAENCPDYSEGKKK
jgi:hypothetical protein